MEIHGVPLMAEGGLIGAYAIYQDRSDETRLQVYEKLLPVCCVCRKIRDDSGKGRGKGAWGTLDAFLTRHSDAQFSHTFRPGCFLSEKEKTRFNQRKS